jgi:signal transduction histidine kinase/CheY-like chemotaxis protein
MTAIMASGWFALCCALLGFGAARAMAAGLRWTRPPDPAKPTVGALEAVLAHYIGEDRANRAFAGAASQDRNRLAERQDLDTIEAQLGPILGAALARLVTTLLASSPALPQEALLQQIDAVRGAMRESREILDQVIARSQQGMYFYDRDLRLVTWNKAGLDILELPDSIVRVGVGLNEVIRACAERGLYGPGSVDELAASRAAAILDAATITRTRSTGSNKIFDMRSIRTPDGGLLILNTDVTEQAVAEEQLEAENETLERRVRERTEELERLNAAYAKAKAEAEEANLSKTRFLAAASHDLLQPLNAARLYATSLKERVRAHTVADDSLMLALNVEESLEAVEDMLTALLDISHLDAGAMKTEIAAFRVDDIFRQLYREFEPISSGKGLSLTFVSSTLPIMSDSRLLRRLLQNLVSNAIKYTLEGRVIVGVRRHGPRACIEVWDTGLGIPKSKQTDVFREFERLPSAIMTAPGVGLGLSIVERLSRVLDHQVTIRSKPGRGSVFSVSVPRAAAVTVVHAAAPPGLQGKPRSLEGLIIAAVDNEPAILKGMEALLRGWDCTIVVGIDLASVEAALRARELTPDVVIADYHIGETDGLALVDALKARFSACHAVLVTADRSAEVRALALKADVRLLNKPLKPAALRSLLSQWHLLKKVVR